MQKLTLIYLNSRSDCKIISELSINNPTVVLLKPVICLSNKSESRKSSYI